MLNLRLLLVVTSTSLLFMFISCNKNDVISPNDILSQKLLTRITIDSANYSLFTYQNDKLIEYKNVFNSKINFDIKIDYNDNNLPQTEYGWSSLGETKTIYYYNSSLELDSADILIKDSTNTYKLVRHYKCDYNSLKELIGKKIYDSEYNLLFITTYTYDAQGNNIMQQMNRPSGFFKKVTMKYDNKINPWYQLRRWLKDNYSTMSRNNMISQRVEYNANDSSSNVNSDYKYDYDSDNYPISRVEVFSTGGYQGTAKQTYAYQNK